MVTHSSTHSRPFFLYPAVLVLFLAILFASGRRAEAQSPIQQGAPWEGSLTSKVSWSNPYQDLQVIVTFTQGSQSLQTYAFWRGGTSFSMRAAFPTPGTWSWSTQCSLVAGGACTGETFSGGTGLHGAAGTVTVQGYDMNLKAHVASTLYTKGMIKPVAATATTRGYFKYSKTNEAFQWVGDTAWSAPIRATLSQWSTYVQKLATAGFTVVQIATPVDYMDGSSGAQPGTVDTPSLKPFTCSGAEPSQLPDASCWMNNTYWDRFDKMVKAANDKGIVVVVAGVMERVVEDTNAYPDLTATKTFARNLAARLAGRYVIFSPAFDHSATSSGLASLDNRIRTIGAEIRKVTNGANANIRPLITNHSAGSDLPGDLTKFQSETWLDFYLFQSGQAAKLAGQTSDPLQTQHKLIFERAATFPVNLSGKVNVNGELIYEGGAAPCALCPLETTCTTKPVKKCTDQATYGVYYTADSQRKGLWMSFMNGAAGGTIGVVGTADWQSNGATSSSSGSWTGATRFKAFLDLLTDWNTLRPSSTRVTAPLPSTLQAWQQIYAIENSGKTGVAVYFPEQVTASVKTTDVTPCRTEQWFNPRATEIQTITATSQTRTCNSTGTSCNYTPPAGGDWILLFKKSACVPTSGLLSVSAGTVAISEDDTGWALFGQKLDAQGEPVGEAVQITEAQIGVSPKRIQLLENPDGANLVAWESEVEAEVGPSRIFAVQVDTKGSPLGEPITLGTASEGRAVDPSLTLTPTGDYVVAWSVLSEEGGEVHAQMIDDKGTPGEDATVAVLAGAEPVEPMVSADANGDLAVAWTEASEADTIIAFRRLDTTGEPLGRVEYPLYHLDGTYDTLSSLDLAGGVIGLQWANEDAEGTTQGVFACGFTATGLPAGAVMTVWDP